MKKRRELGAENVKKRDLEHYLKSNPKLAKKIKHLEQLKREHAEREAAAAAEKAEKEKEKGTKTKA